MRRRSRPRPENRKQIAEAIAPANYLNQPVTVVEQVLTGTFADGLGNIRKEPNRIDFDPFPWQSFAVWILTQMKRWGQIKGDVDYAKVAREVFLATDAAKLMKEAGLKPPAATNKKFTVMGKEFDPAQARRLSRELRDQADGLKNERHQRLGRAAALDHDPARLSRHLARGNDAGDRQAGGERRVREARRRQCGDRTEVVAAHAGRCRPQALGAS